MNSNLNRHKRNLGLRWIRATSGNTFLCPADAVEHLEGADEKKLQSLCLQESLNPQND